MTDLLFGLLLGALGLLPAVQAGAPSQDKSGIATLEWLSGLWAGTEHGTRMEELWLHPAGGLMLGVHRDVDSAGMTWFEYLRIESTESGIAYVASPGGRGPTSFPMKEMTKNSVVFENLDHDFPQRIVYRLENDILHARIEGIEEGKMKIHEWVWRRAP